MIVRIPTLLFFLFAFSLLRGQIIVPPADAIWSAEAVSRLHFDPDCGSMRPVEAIPLKVQQPRAMAASPSPFTDALTAHIRSGNWPAYSPQRYQPIPHDKAMQLFVRTDSIISFDPETYEESITVVQTDLLSGCEDFLVRQLWSYSDADGFSAQAVAIAPVLPGPEESAYAPVWFALPEAKARYNEPTHRRVTQATLLQYALPEQQMQDLSGSLPDFKRNLLQQFQEGQITGYRRDRSLIPASEIEGIFNATDTIFTIDPETYTENFEVVEREFRSEDVTAFLAEQAWYFEPRSGRLQCELLRFAPARPVVDEFGTLRYFEPLFYWQRR